MLRFLLVFFSALFAIALANVPQTRNVEKAEGFSNELVQRNEKLLDRLTKLVYDQIVEIRNLVMEQNEEQKKNFNATNRKMEELANLVDKRHNQTLETFNRKLSDLAKQHQKEFEDIKTSIRCTAARRADLTMLANGKKYSLHETEMSWYYANETCVSQGLHLATIKDQKDAEVVAKHCQRVAQWYGFWVSAKNSASGVEKDFRWHDGTKLELDNQSWKDDAERTEDCVFIYNWSDGKLNTNSCAGTWYVICELPSECY
ncbi:uncharacterized protein LOC132193946 [Neocloeon triangulifer]|uniref:uncharacterized protein LOC132193946 n=1 Tax=Neocloeon triangulifer TaxID=2078957 RepID=UPI00286F986E|nr:uncharacterized protein LOC132193946 [Neocloeon triangulifer]